LHSQLWTIASASAMHRLRATHPDPSSSLSGRDPPPAVQVGLRLYHALPRQRARAAPPPEHHRGHMHAMRVLIEAHNALLLAPQSALQVHWGRWA
jgi:hypothetical protein